MRAVYIYITWVKSLFHKAFDNLGREIVVAACSSVLLGLFFYMFSDFLNVQLSAIPQAMQENITEYFSFSLCLISALVSISMIRNDSPSAHFSISNWLYYNGESPNSLLTYRLMRSTTISVFFNYGCYLLIIEFIDHPPENLFLASMISVFVSASIGLLLPPKKDSFDKIKKTLPTSPLYWRLGLITLRNKITKALLLICALSSVLFLHPKIIATPLFIWALFFSIGTICSFALYIFLAEEISTSWLEKNSGMSHQQFMGLSTKVSVIVTSFLVLLGSLLFIGSLGIHGHTYNAFFVIQMFFVGLTPGILVPNLILQIDARRSQVNMMAGFLVALFTCTAIFAHILAVFLIPIIFYYGQTTQVDRYYRA